MYRQLVHIANPLTIGCPLHCLIYYALCLPELNWSKLGGAQMDFEEVLDRRVDFPVCPSGDFVERIKKYRVPIDIGLQSGTVSFS